MFGYTHAVGVSKRGGVVDLFEHGRLQPLIRPILLIPLVLLVASCDRESATKPAGSSRSPAPAASRPPEPSQKPSAQPARVTVSQGTVIHIALSEGVASGTSQVGDTFTARTTEPVVVADRVAIPAGSTIRGQVSAVTPAKKGLSDKGGMLTLSFDKLETPSGFSAPMSASISSLAKSGKKTAGIIGGSAAGGAILGKVLGGSTKDAAVGAVVGGAIGTGIAAGTKGKDVEIPSGSHLSVTLNQALTIAVPS
jgi:hypothetical protein